MAHRTCFVDLISKARPRFWAKVDKSGDCWLWMASKNAHGYGVFGIGGRKDGTRLAHRVAWAYEHGELCASEILDHICRNPSCVRPSHLRIVTEKENRENHSGAYSTSGSGIRGVSWDKSRERWKATVTHNYKQVMVGRFATIEEAEAAVLAKRLDLFTHNDLDSIA